MLVARQPESIPASWPRGDPPGAPVPVRGPRLSLRGTSESLDLRAIAALEPADPLGLRIAGRVAEFLGRTVALSELFNEPGGRPTEEANARATLDAAERLAEPPLVARAARLAAYRLLASLGSLPDDRMQATALLEPLLGGRPASVRERLATLRAVLDHGAAGEAANRLGIDRNTLAYRVRNLEARDGWDLDDPELRLALSVAVRVVQSAQQTRARRGRTPRSEATTAATRAITATHGPFRAVRTSTAAVPGSAQEGALAIEEASEALARIEAARQGGIRFIQIQFTDILGVVKAVTIPIHRLEDSVRHGTWFDGSSIEGFTRIAESDQYLAPGMSTFNEIPWQPGTVGAAPPG